MNFFFFIMPSFQIKVLWGNIHNPQRLPTTNLQLDCLWSFIHLVKAHSERVGAGGVKEKKDLDNMFFFHSQDATWNSYLTYPATLLVHLWMVSKIQRMVQGRERIYIKLSKTPKHYKSILRKNIIKVKAMVFISVKLF